MAHRLVMVVSKNRRSCICRLRRMKLTTMFSTSKPKPDETALPASPHTQEPTIKRNPTTPSKTTNTMMTTTPLDTTKKTMFHQNRNKSTNFWSNSFKLEKLLMRRQGKGVGKVKEWVRGNKGRIVMPAGRRRSSLEGARRKR